ncbi:hypothetical protein OAP11_05195 [Bacteroidia bacterium]|nr:hypothetical protein [Bacteroidia bacterium]
MKIKPLIGGLLIGLAIPVAILWGVKQYHFSHMTFSLFIQTGFATGTLSPWLKIATLFNLIPFFGFINKNQLKVGQGIILATLIYGLFIVYFTLM